MTRKRIAYYISSHGFGHAARSAIVLGELARDYELFITSEIPEAYYRTVVPEFHFRSAPVDTGCVQADFVTVDQSKSFKNLADLLSRAEEISRRETTWLRDNAIDLVISDVIIPGLGGTEVVRRIRERRPDVRALLISGYADVATIEEISRSGLAFLAKPFTPAELVAALADALERG